MSQTPTLLIDELDPQSIQLCEDLVSWLPTCLPGDIAQYAHSLPEDFWEQLPAFRKLLLDTIRKRRNQDLAAFLGSNAYLVMDEVAVLRFISALAQYNQPSVIASFRKQYPGLQATPNPQPVNRWATTALALWSNAFYLLTYKRYLDCAVYLKSLAKLNLSLEMLDNACTVSRQLVEQIGQHIADHNFQSFPLPIDLARSASGYLDSLTFLPAEYTRGLVASADSHPLYELISSLLYAFTLLSDLLTKAKSLSDEPGVLRVLQERLANDAEQEALVESSRKRLAASPVSPEIAAPVSALVGQLEELITVPNISSGYTMQYLRAYLAGLTPEQRAGFADVLKEFLRQSPIVAAVLDQIDIDFFIGHISGGSLGASKADFIESLAKFVDPPLWPLAQKTMLMMASLLQ